jgi:hypothetical protein
MSCEEYYIHGVMHREDGPAKIYYDSSGKNPFHQYWLNGKEVTKDQYLINQLNKIIAPYDLEIQTELVPENNQLEYKYKLESIMHGLTEDEIRASRQYYTDLTELQNTIMSYIQ